MRLLFDIFDITTLYNFITCPGSQNEKSAPKYRCSRNIRRCECKRSYYRSANAIFGKIDRLATGYATNSGPCWSMLVCISIEEAVETVLF